MKQRTRDIYAAALTARELAERTRQKIAEFKKPGKLRKATPERRAVNSVKRRAAFKIIGYGKLLVKHRALKNYTKRPLYAVKIGIDIGAVNRHAAAVLGELTAYYVYRR